MISYYKRDGWVYRSCDNTPIPACAGNTDWDEYQAWLAEGNTPQLYEPPAIDPKEKAKAELAASDKDLARIAEDLIDVLKTKGLITDSDLPQAVRDKLIKRKQLRDIIKM